MPRRFLLNRKVLQKSVYKKEVNKKMAVQLVLDSHFLFNYHAADFFLTGLDYKFTV